MYRNTAEFTSPRIRHAVAILVAAVLVSFCGSIIFTTETETRVATEDFSHDPNWDGRNQTPPDSHRRTIEQDFGFSSTRHAGGEAGEIGGRVSRSVRPATYARSVFNRTLNDRLSASGRFAVTKSEGGSGVLIGWFNFASRGWRTPNSLVFRIDGEDGHFRVFFEYGTNNWKTGGGTTFEGRYQTTSTPMFVADGTPHRWRLDYDPLGAEGRGEIIFTLDDHTYRAALAPGHKTDGAIFNRFGILNQQTVGEGMTIYLDDVVIDGRHYDFASDPNWEGVGNRVRFDGGLTRAIHDFGFRDSAHAGGKAGEIGGFVWRIESMLPERAFFYAAPIEALTLDIGLVASGRISLHSAAADSAVLIGWFNSHTAAGAPPANFVGVLIEGPSRIGHYFRPVYATSEGQGVVKPTGPLIRPDARSRTWHIHYDPTAADGQGVVRVTLEEETVELELGAGARQANAALNRFGVVSWHRGGHHVELYLDDLSFTAARKK